MLKIHCLVLIEWNPVLVLIVYACRQCWIFEGGWKDYKLNVCDACKPDVRFCPTAIHVTVSDIHQSTLELHLTEIEVYGRPINKRKTINNVWRLSVIKSARDVLFLVEISDIRLAPSKAQDVQFRFFFFYLIKNIQKERECANISIYFWNIKPFHALISWIKDYEFVINEIFVFSCYHYQANCLADNPDSWFSHPLRPQYFHNMIVDYWVLY